jgi:hypothetical protein
MADVFDITSGSGMPLLVIYRRISVTASSLILKLSVQGRLFIIIDATFSSIMLHNSLGLNLVSFGLSV